MFEPIILNGFREKLMEILQGDLCDKSRFRRSVCLGHHSCEDRMYYRIVSDTHACIFCVGCKFRLVFPIEIDTYGKLRDWCTEQIRREQEERIDRARSIIDHARC